MHEIELKFQVPDAGKAAVRRAIDTPRASTIRLRAVYFDTPGRGLAAAGMALRLRQEGRRWVQTLKGRGDGLMHRLEHEVVLAPSRAMPSIDPLRHADSPAGQAMAGVLGETLDALIPIYSTDIRRTRRTVRGASGSQIELAYDVGEIRAADARLPVCELEFELVRGPSAALPELASRWVSRHGLWLDVRSKAERGDRLARGGARPDAVKSAGVALRADMTGPQALRTMLTSALDQVLSNACELIDGGSVEHLHQCRVGLRRLRSMLRDFGALAGEPVPLAFAGWNDALASLFRRLGCTRDLDVLRDTLQPVLQAGGPPLAFLDSRPAGDDPGALLREPGVNRLWLELLAWLHAPSPSVGTDAVPPLAASLNRRLRRLHRQVVADAVRFASLDEPAQHRVRKRLKRLRYGLQSCAALLPKKALRRRLAVVSAALEALGDYGDQLTARDLLSAQVAQHPEAWFALGWLAARRDRTVRACTRALSRFAELPRR